MSAFDPTPVLYFAATIGIMTACIGFLMWIKGHNDAKRIKAENGSFGRK